MIANNINRQSKLPYYQQLYEILHTKIAQGEWLPGDMMPPESEMIEIYQVSRNTIRQVLDMLVNEGLIYRQRGRGTFVAHPSIEQAMIRIISFTEDMRQRGFEPGTEVLESTLIPAPRDISERIEVTKGEELAKIVRLRLADGEPMSVEEAYLIHKYCPNVLNHNFAKQPLRQVLDRDYGIRLVNAKQVIRAVSASDELGHILEIPAEAALLFIERVSYSQHAIPIEFLHIYYRSDRYSLYNELHD